MRHESVSKPIEILLVEDDPGDIDLIRETLEQNKILIHLQVVQDGVSALAYLRKEGPYVNAKLPDLILLDLNLPRKNGREVLDEIKRDENLKHIPVVVLTTSDADADIMRSYNLGANCYVTKPLGLDQFAMVVTSIKDFWFTIVRLWPQ
ncbi:MAG: response regulator [Nitrospira sp.]|nr:response regulator [Nitrospira sp.]